MSINWHKKKTDIKHYCLWNKTGRERFTFEFGLQFKAEKTEITQMLLRKMLLAFTRPSNRWAALCTFGSESADSLQSASKTSLKNVMKSSLATCTWVPQLSLSCFSKCTYSSTQLSVHLSQVPHSDPMSISLKQGHLLRKSRFPRTPLASSKKHEHM
jgi:hypothetical protein